MRVARGSREAAVETEEGGAGTWKQIGAVDLRARYGRKVT